MKNPLPLLFAIASITFLYQNIFAQTTVPNGNFESWYGVGSSTEAPTNWNSNKDGGGNATSGPQTCFQESNNPHGGSYCVRVVSGSTFGVVVNGICTNGKVEAPTFTKSDGYIHTIPNDATYSSPFTGRPDSLVGWYRYSSQSGDAAKVQVYLHVNGAANPESGNYQGNTSANIIGRALYTTPPSSVSSWTRFSVPFIYADARTPAYFFGVITSSADAAGGTSGSTFWVDDLDVIYNPVLTTGAVATGPYYVTPNTGANISVPFTLTGTVNTGNMVTVQLSDANGSFASPVNIGSANTTTSGAINAIIPANTVAGNAYRVRVVMNNPALTATDNGSNITINLVNTSISPSTVQNIGANTNGTALTLTETPAANSHEWRYGTISGGPYTPFSPSQTGSTYVPNFANAGTYYVIAYSSYPGSILVKSNEVRINVVKNTISPASSQSLLVGVNGNQLTVSESPVASSREWKYATTSGGPYQSFSSANTLTTLTPNFAISGTYYIVCQSVISGVTATSNEVIISVGNATITTGTIFGSPFLFSPNAHNVATFVPYSTSGTFNAGNIFTAQLSDSTGSFANPTTIGTKAAIASGTINGVIQYTTPQGSGYRVRVVSSNPPIFGNDNGIDLVVDQFHNSITPAAAQSVLYGTAASPLTVNESQVATRVWKKSTTSGGPYTNFTPSDTVITCTPLFNNIGTYYIVAVSQNTNADQVTSNEVQINVVNGTTLATDSVLGSPFLVSPKAHVAFPVSFTTNVLYNSGNVFTVQLSDATGSFTTPTIIGLDTNTIPSAINCTLPNASQAGNAYRIRVVSSNPAIIGSDNGTDLKVIPFAINVSPADTQHLYTNQIGTTLSITESQPSTREWLVSTVAGFNYFPLTPPETGNTFTPKFDTKNAHFIICKSINGVNDTLNSREVVVLVIDSPTGINNFALSAITAYWQGDNFIIDTRQTQLANPVLHLFNTLGQEILTSAIKQSAINTVETHFMSSGIYLFSITDGEKTYNAKTMK